jgi:hypothetical protein
MNRYAANHAGRNYGCRIREFILRGYRCFTLENELLRITVAAEKGADIVEFLWKPLDLDVLWHSPLGLRNIGQLGTSSPLEEGNFRDFFAGGWYEMLPNGPAPCTHRGAHWGFHGEATLLPWEYKIDKDDQDEIQVTLVVRLVRIPILVTKTMTLRSRSGMLSIRETLTNESQETVQFLWGQHPTFGWPFLEEGCRIFLPSCVASVGDPRQDGRLAQMQRIQWPIVPGRDGNNIDLSILPPPESKSHDFVRLEQLDDGWFAIVNPHRKLGWALCWDVRLFPVLGYWQLFRGAKDYPWYGMHYLAALEPANDLPSIADAVKRKTAFELQGGATLNTTWEATAFDHLLEVNAVLPEGVVR